MRFYVNASNPDAKTSAIEAPRIDISPLADQIGFRMRLASAAANRSFSKALDPLKVSQADYGALTLIGANPGLIQQELATALAMQRANLVRVLNDLEARGLVIRGGNRRRENSLYLTEEGERFLPVMHAAHETHQQRMVDALNTDLASAIEVLRGIGSVRV